MFQVWDHQLCDMAVRLWCRFKKAYGPVDKSIAKAYRDRLIKCYKLQYKAFDVSTIACMFMQHGFLPWATYPYAPPAGAARNAGVSLLTVLPIYWRDSI